MNLNIKSVIDRVINDEEFAKELQTKLNQIDGLASTPQELAELNVNRFNTSKKMINGNEDIQPTMTTNYCALIERLRQDTMTTNYCALIDQIMQNTRTTSCCNSANEKIIK